jgi:hypothetical protein
MILRLLLKAGEIRMGVELQDTQKSFAATLADVADSIRDEQRITVRRLFEAIGEQGLLLFCMILMLPFLLPVSVPGVSTIFSIVVILVGISVTLNRIPWLPERLMKRELDAKSLVNAMEHGANTFARIDRVIRPRLLFMSDSAVTNRLNGVMFIFGGILLVFPFGLVPFSNTLPGLAILLLAAGIIQRDGLLIIAGYVMNVVTIIYFGGLFAAAIAAGQGITALLGS